MAVDADDVALRDLPEELAARLQHRRTTPKVEGLRGGVSVIEVHDTRLEGLSAIETWNASQTAQPCQRRALSADDALDLALAIPRVVRHVVGPGLALSTLVLSDLVRSFRWPLLAIFGGGIAAGVVLQAALSR